MGLRHSKGLLLIRSTSPDLPFFGQLVRLSECPMTSITTASPGVLVTSFGRVTAVKPMRCHSAIHSAARVCRLLFCRRTGRNVGIFAGEHCHSTNIVVRDLASLVLRGSSLHAVSITHHCRCCRWEFSITPFFFFFFFF